MPACRFEYVAHFVEGNSHKCILTLEGFFSFHHTHVQHCFTKSPILASFRIWINIVSFLGHSLQLDAAKGF